MSLITVERAREMRKDHKLVFTNGVFDLLHAGHVRLLKQARALGDLLIVGINSDDSARGLGKGDHRPISTAEDRAEVLSAVRWVDAVVSFDERTPIRLIESLRPEVHVKGGDYAPDALPEAHVVRSYGGEVVIIPLHLGRSTTSMLKQLGLE